MLYQRGDVENDSEERKETDKNREMANGEAKNSPVHRNLLKRISDLQEAKASNEKGRIFLQAPQKGGQGEPFYRCSDGFESVLMKWMDFGRDVFTLKYSRGPCDPRHAGL